MTIKLKWVLCAFVIVIVGFVALQIYLYVDMEDFKKEHSLSDNGADKQPPQVQRPSATLDSDSLDNERQHEPFPQKDVNASVDNDQSVKQQVHSVPGEHLTPEEFNALPAEERMARYELYRKQYREIMGVEAPPLGAKWGHAKDGEGNIVKVYPNTFTPFKLKTRIGFAPTLEQFQRYNRLKDQKLIAQLNQKPEEVKRINDEINKLIEDAQGEIPDSFGASVYDGRGESPEEAARNSERQQKAALLQAYRDYGLEHIAPAYLKQ